MISDVSARTITAYLNIKVTLMRCERSAIIRWILFVFMFHDALFRENWLFRCFHALHIVHRNIARKDKQSLFSLLPLATC